MPHVVGGQFEHLPDWYTALIRSFMEQSEILRKQEYPQYKEPRIAALPDYVLKSYELARALGKYEPYYGQAKELLESSKVPYGKQIEQYMSPYIEQVVEGLGKKGKRILTEQIMPALEAKFVGLGQHGSSRHRDLSLRAARDLQESILEKQQEALARGFEQASNIHTQQNMRNLEAARTLGNLGLNAQTGAQQDINLINALGSQEQAHRQQELNEKQAEHWRRMAWPQQNLAQQANILHGSPSPSMGSTYMQYTPPTAIPQVNQMGQMGSMAAQLYGLGQMPARYKWGGHINKTPRLSSLKFRKKKSTFPKNLGIGVPSFQKRIF